MCTLSCCEALVGVLSTNSCSSSEEAGSSGSCSSRSTPSLTTRSFLDSTIFFRSLCSVGSSPLTFFGYGYCSRLSGMVLSKIFRYVCFRSLAADSPPKDLSARPSRLTQGAPLLRCERPPCWRPASSAARQRRKPWLTSRRRTSPGRLRRCGSSCIAWHHQGHHGLPRTARLRVVERVEHVDQTLGEVINIKHLFNIWRPGRRCYHFRAKMSPISHVNSREIT